ncbi:MAG: alkaline phosphatase family protein, partial [Gloeobacteraceae cyanobacterium ES-bin-316]|nr:alkaline phosphatase family protein [Ferruginibacter sp.]
MITKFKASLFFLILTIFGAVAQEKPTTNKNLNQPVARPKLVVGLVIDQMRWDYLYRYQNLYSSGGFKRLLSQGYSFENTMVPFTPTYTAPGHTG